MPGQRVGEQALLASRRRPARSLKRLSAPADGALRSRHEVGTRAGTPLDFGAAASTTLERSAGTGSHGAKPTRERRRSCATTSRRRRAGCARLRASSAASRGPRRRVHALKRAMSSFGGGGGGGWWVTARRNFPSRLPRIWGSIRSLYKRAHPEPGGRGLGKTAALELCDGVCVDAAAALRHRAGDTTRRRCGRAGTVCARRRPWHQP